MIFTAKKRQRTTRVVDFSCRKILIDIFMVENVNNQLFSCEICTISTEKKNDYSFSWELQSMRNQYAINMCAS